MLRKLILTMTLALALPGSAGCMIDDTIEDVGPGDTLTLALEGEPDARPREEPEKPDEPDAGPREEVDAGPRVEVCNSGPGDKRCPERH
jgi:hypothetical protein